MTPLPCVSSMPPLPNIELTPPAKPAVEILELLLSEYDALPAPGNPAEVKLAKSQKRALLEEAYQSVVQIFKEEKPTIKAYFLASRVLMLYGELVYDEKYSFMMGMSRAALNLQFYALGCLGKICFDFTAIPTLSEFKASAMNHQDFHSVDEFLLQTGEGSEFNSKFDGLISPKFFSDEDLLLIAKTLSNYGFACVHTPGYCESENPKNIERFEKIFGLAKKIYELKLEVNLQFNEGLAELFYNGYRGLALKKGESLASAHKCLDWAKSLNPSLSMKARVLNLKGCDWQRAGNKKEAMKYYKEALAVREKMQHSGDDIFLLANARNNYGNLSLEYALELAPENPDLSVAEAYVKQALEYAEARRGARDPASDKVLDPSNDHQYFGFYDTNMAKILICKKDFKGAKRHLARALETYLRHEETSGEHIKKVLSLSQECDQKLKKQQIDLSLDKTLFTFTSFFVAGSPARPDLTASKPTEEKEKKAGFTPTPLNILGYVPVLSTLTGALRAIASLVHAIASYVLFCANGNDKQTRLEEMKWGFQSFARGMVEMVPIFGNIAAFSWDRYRISQLENEPAAPKEEKPPKFQPKVFKSARRKLDFENM